MKEKEREREREKKEGERERERGWTCYKAVVVDKQVRGHMSQHISRIETLREMNDISVNICGGEQRLR